VRLTARVRDESGLVGKMVVTLLLIVLLVGIVAVEAGSIIFTKLSLENTASTAAADGARELAATHSRDGACQAAAISVIDSDDSAEMKLCVANPQTGEVTIRVRKVASTLIVQHVSFLRKLGVVKATAETGPGKV
jgi:Flp pilus assembly protein TadG